MRRVLLAAMVAALVASGCASTTRDARRSTAPGADGVEPAAEAAEPGASDPEGPPEGLGGEASPAADDSGSTPDAPAAAARGAGGSSPSGAAPSADGAGKLPAQNAAGRPAGGTVSPGGAGSTEPSGSPAPAPVPGGRPGGRLPVPAGVAGVTDAEIRIGLQFNDDASDSTFQAVGARGATTGDVGGSFKALIDHVNANGGVGGRKLAGVYHKVNNSDGTFDSQAQVACTRFTEDEPVFAAVLDGNFNTTLPACLADRKVVTIPTYNIFFDDKQLTDWAPYVYWPGFISGDRLAVYVDGLAEQGYFDKGAKVGLLRWDTPHNERVARTVVRPALDRHGIKSVDEVAVSDVKSVAALGGIAAELGNAILRFRSRGVTHVLFVGTQGAVPFFFLPQAESQGYRPRYGWNSFEHPEFIRLSAPPEQFRRSLGVGWYPRRDVAEANDPGGNPASDLCVSILRKAGKRPADRASADQMESTCEGIFFLKGILDRAHEVSAAGIRAVADRIRDYGSPTTFAASFPAGRFDGASAYRPFGYIDDCSCWRYTGPLKPIP